MLPLCHYIVADVATSNMLCIYAILNICNCKSNGQRHFYLCWSNRTVWDDPTGILLILDESIANVTFWNIVVCIIAWNLISVNAGNWFVVWWLLLLALLFIKLFKMSSLASSDLFAYSSGVGLVDATSWVDIFLNVGSYLDRSWFETDPIFDEVHIIFFWVAPSSLQSPLDE